MLKSLLPLVLFLGLARASPQEETWILKIVESYAQQTKFLERLFGCPPNTDNLKNCNPAKGVYDVSEFLKTRKLVKEAYGL